MKQGTQSSFNEGLLMDMNPLVTPQTCLSDCLNGTLITFNGNEFTLQNDSGNVIIEGGNLPNGFIPVGVKEYGGIIYTALLNPVTNVCQIGSIPSPDYNLVPKNQSKNGTNIAFDGVNFKDNVTKLFEFDQLTLNPGDKYKIVYSIQSSDISKIYNVKWLAIDESGKQYDLKSPNVVFSELDDFQYFNQTIKAIIGLEVTLNNIDWFEAACYSKRTDNNQFNVNLQIFGKNRIQRNNNAIDDLYIRGCKIEYTTDKSNNKRVKYIWDKLIYDNHEIGIPENILQDTFNPSVSLEETFDENTEININITPFDQFKYLTNLERTLYLKTGESVILEGINDLFQYKYSSLNKSLRLDFNANLKGIENPIVYLEFYDLWSDYSVIIPVNDPNPFGKNSLFITTSSEKCTMDFTNSRGGIDTNQLIKFNNGDLQIPTLNGTDQLIRKNQILRENNLYIVKISIFDDSETPELRKYSNVYKVFTLNENMNKYYDEYQLTENPSFKDFTKLSQLNNTIDVNYNKLNIVTDAPVINVDDSKLTLKTNNNYYLLTDVDLPQNNEECTRSVSKKKTYNLGIDINTESLGYGYVDKFLLGNLEIKNVETNITETNNQITSSLSSVSLLSNANNIITVDNILSTTRSIKTNIQKEVRLVRSKLDESSVWDTILTDNNNPHGYIRNWGNKPHPRVISKGIGKDKTINTTDRITDTEINNYLKRADIIDNRVISGGVLYWDNTPKGFVDVWGDKHDHWCTSQVGTTDVPTHVNNFLICLLNDNGNFYPVFTINKESAINVLKNIFSSRIEEKEYRLYYYGDIVSDNMSTTYTKPVFTVSAQSSINFKQYIHSASKSVNTDILVNEINKLIISSDNQATPILQEDVNAYLNIINDNLPINFKIELDELSITDSSDVSILNKLTSSKVDLEFNESSKLISSTLPNKTPYSTIYSNIANKFSVSYINNEKPKFVYKHANLQRSRWYINGGGSKDAYLIDTNILEL